MINHTRAWKVTESKVSEYSIVISQQSQQEKSTKMLVWPVSTYGCESEAINKVDEWQIETAEVRGLCQMMTFLWTAKKTNERNLKNVIAVRTACYQVLKQKCTVTFLDM